MKKWVKDPPSVIDYYNMIVEANNNSKYGPPKPLPCYPVDEPDKYSIKRSYSPERVDVGLGCYENLFMEFRRVELKKVEEEKELKKQEKERKKLKREKEELKKEKKEGKSERKRKGKMGVTTEDDEDGVPLKKLKLDEVEADANQVRKLDVPVAGDVNQQRQLLSQDEQSRNLMKGGLKPCSTEDEKKTLNDSKKA